MPSGVVKNPKFAGKTAFCRGKLERIAWRKTVWVALNFCSRIGREAEAHPFVRWVIRRLGRGRGGEAYQKIREREFDGRKTKRRMPAGNAVVIPRDQCLFFGEKRMVRTGGKRRTMGDSSSWEGLM